MHFNDIRDFRMIGAQVFKFKFQNFTYHEIKTSTGGAYAPYAPCMGTPLPAAELTMLPILIAFTQLAMAVSRGIL